MLSPNPEQGKFSIWPKRLTTFGTMYPYLGRSDQTQFGDCVLKKVGSLILLHSV